jgi:amino acid transporter
MLWVATGAGWVVYAFVCTLVGCTTNQCTNDEFWFVLWNGEPGVIAEVGNLAETVWPLLAVIALVAGFVLLRGWRRRNWRRAAAWAGAWVAGIVLIILVAIVAGLGSEAPSVAWGALELPIFAAWLVLGARVNRILSTPCDPRRQDLTRGSRKRPTA